ncbi:response regulator [uncultured Desulfobacter sp.]|uniref:hybrid sensor histidine kinase/response regulator n=1 Tax=uncultured Desulfobacter sp. TaxID=240139 RepID=UPI0029F54BC0|nr:response regulator [uncultured Desulfobacter sp.]
MVPQTEWKIVLIDDEPGIRKVTAIVLEDWGYQVETAENGEAGLKACAAFLPQIVITDIKMPGMDGLCVLETIGNDHPDMVVIVMTAFGDVDTAIRALQLDASDFITKPVNDQALGLALDRAKKRYTSAKKIREYTSRLETGWSSATETLMKKYRFQEQIINRSMNGIIACGMDDFIRIINPAAQEMFGVTAEQVMGKKTLKDLMPVGEYERILDALKSGRYGGKDRINMMEVVMQSSMGQQIPVRVSASVMFDAGDDNGLLFCVRDLRKIRRMEREMADQEKTLHQDKIMSLGKLAASVVHEINNPLSGILNYLKLMAKLLDKGQIVEKQDKFSSFLDIAISEISRCSDILSNLLTFSRKSPISYGPVQVKDLVERCVKISGHKFELQNIELHVDIEDRIPDILADVNQIQQCLINLMFNAMDAMDGPGPVWLFAGFDPGKQQVFIQVKDSGKGISQKDLPHIFEPFFTTKDEGHGVGLGLSTVYGIMRSHGGDIRVADTSEKGTCFVLEFNKLV